MCEGNACGSAEVRMHKMTDQKIKLHVQVILSTSRVFCWSSQTLGTDVRAWSCVKVRSANALWFALLGRSRNFIG
jgi:hypothetical protein